MRRILALALGLCVFASPAFAAITQISGTGSAGAIANITFNAGTSVALTTTAGIAPGSLVVLVMSNVSTGTSTGFTGTDSAGNTYASCQAVVANTNAATQVLYSYTANDLPNGSTITGTQTSGPSGITGSVLAFRGTSGTPCDAATPAGVTGTSATPTVGPTGTLACPGAAAGCELLIGAVSWVTAGTVTMDANFTGYAFGAGDNWGLGFWIVGATTARSFAPTNSASSNFAGQLIAFKAAAPLTGSSALTTTGAGP